MLLVVFWNCKFSQAGEAVGDRGGCVFVCSAGETAVYWHALVSV